MEELKNGERLKMRHWLEQAIDSGEYPGVEWTDKHHGTFRVPWTHASRHGWDIDKDASLFKMWAMYTGKYPKDIQGLSQKQKRHLAKNWKANFRCALNALPHDIQVLRGEGKSKGKDAYKVYRLLPQQRRKGITTKRRLNSQGCEDDTFCNSLRTESKVTPRRNRGQEFNNNNNNSSSLVKQEENYTLTLEEHNYSDMVSSYRKDFNNPYPIKEEENNYNDGYFLPERTNIKSEYDQQTYFDNSYQSMSDDVDTSGGSSCSSDMENETNNLIGLFSQAESLTTPVSQNPITYEKVLTELVNISSNINSMSLGHDNFFYLGNSFDNGSSQFLKGADPSMYNAYDSHQEQVGMQF